MFIILAVQLNLSADFSNPKNDSSGHKCPKGFDCIKLDKLGKVKTGFIGFDEFASSVFTVYTGSSCSL